MMHGRSADMFNLHFTTRTLGDDEVRVNFFNAASQSTADGRRDGVILFLHAEGATHAATAVIDSLQADARNAL